MKRKNTMLKKYDMNNSINKKSFNLFYDNKLLIDIIIFIKFF